MESLNSIATYYETHFLSLLPQFAIFAPFYGWLATASVAIALIAMIFVIFNRERGREAASAIGQHILVYASPILLSSVL